MNKIDKVIPSKEFLDDSEETMFSGEKESLIISCEKKWNIDKLYELLVRG